MRKLFIADVGHGFCLAIDTLAGAVTQVDCGNLHSEEVAYEGWRRILHQFPSPSCFILSHFHTDHYNGLLYASLMNQTLPKAIREVMFPGMPDFAEREEFLRCIMAMNAELLGSRSGVMAYDLLMAVTKVNGGHVPALRPLFKDKVAMINSSRLRVLWPPRVISEDSVRVEVRRALRQFHEAIEKDQTLRDTYEYVCHQGTYSNYLAKEPVEAPKICEAEVREHERRELPSCVEEANNSLRKAMNRLGLAFHEDNRLLFLGDAEKEEIGNIVGDLKSKGRDTFRVFLTPHHGTHWHASLDEIRALIAVTSNGRFQRMRHKSRVENMSVRSLATRDSGDIVIDPYTLIRLGDRSNRKWVLV